MISVNPRRGSTAHGFTLIELLVVIAIIAILASILFPVFAQAREKARQTACLSNVKQISLAMMQYAQDHDETFPPGRYYGFAAGDSWSWDHYIAPYAQKSGAVTYGQGQNPYLECPSDVTERQTTVAGKRSYAIPMWYGADLAWKPEVNVPSNTGITEGRAFAEFTAPASTILIAEAPTRTNRIGNNTYFSVRGPSGTSGQIQVPPPNDLPVAKPSHSGGWNYGFADGHAKWFKPEQTITTPGKTYPFRNTSGYNCPGTAANPCAMWTISDND